MDGRSKTRRIGRAEAAIVAFAQTCWNIAAARR
jgi:hypothetical protein